MKTLFAYTPDLIIKIISYWTCILLLENWQNANTSGLTRPRSCLV